MTSDTIDVLYFFFFYLCLKKNNIQNPEKKRFLYPNIFYIKKL